MKIAISVNGILFPLYEATENMISYDLTPCNNCLLNMKHCERLCHRLKEELERRESENSLGKESK